MDQKKLFAGVLYKCVKYILVGRRWVAVSSEVLFLYSFDVKIFDNRNIWIDFILHFIFVLNAWVVSYVMYQENISIICLEFHAIKIK